MDYFHNKISAEAQKKAFDNLAYELLEQYMQNGEDEDLQDTLIRGLHGEKQYEAEYRDYQLWRESNA